MATGVAKDVFGLAAGAGCPGSEPPEPGDLVCHEWLPCALSRRRPCIVAGRRPANQTARPGLRAAAHVGKPLDRRRSAQVLSGRVKQSSLDLTAHCIQIQLVEVELELFAHIGIITARAEGSLQSRKESHVSSQAVRRILVTAAETEGQRFSPASG